MNGTNSDLDREEEHEHGHEHGHEHEHELANEIEIVRKASRDPSKNTKAESVRTQKHLYDKGIEMRIRLQKPMEIAEKALLSKDQSQQSDHQHGAQVERV